MLSLRKLHDLVLANRPDVGQVIHMTQDVYDWYSGLFMGLEMPTFSGYPVEVIAGVNKVIIHDNETNFFDV